MAKSDLVALFLGILLSLSSAAVCPFGHDGSSADESLMLLQRQVAPQSVLLSSVSQEAQQDSAVAGFNFFELGTTVRTDSELNSPAIIESAFPACALVACVVVIVYWPQGPLVISRILVYIFALSSMKLSVKFVFSNFGFNFPKFLTAGHLLLSSQVGFMVLLARRQLYDKALPVPTTNEFVSRIGPIAFAFAFSLAMNNSGLVYCSAAFAEIVGSTTALVTVAVTVLMGLPFNKWLLLPTLVVMIGCALSVSGEMNISVLGTMFCFAANLGRAVKSTMQQDLLTGETRAKFDPCALLAWTCFASALIMITWSVVTEGTAPWVALHTSSAFGPTLAAILASCVNACMLNLVVLYVTKDLGAVGQLIAGQVASVLTVGGGVIIFGDHLSIMQVFGFIIVLGGAFSYSRMSKSGHGHGSAGPTKAKADPSEELKKALAAVPEEKIQDQSAAEATAVAK